MMEQKLRRGPLPILDNPMAQDAPRRDPTAATQFLCGFAGGFCAKFVEHPLDTVKVRMQFAATPFRSPLDCAATIVRQSGVRGLYRGLGAPVGRRGAGKRCCLRHLRRRRELLPQQGVDGSANATSSRRRRADWQRRGPTAAPCLDRRGLLWRLRGAFYVFDSNTGGVRQVPGANGSRPHHRGMLEASVACPHRTWGCSRPTSAVETDRRPPALLLGIPADDGSRGMRQRGVVRNVPSRVYFSAAR